MHVWGCLAEVRICNSNERKLDPRTISTYFIGYNKKSKGYQFYCPTYSTRIVESKNAKFYCPTYSITYFIDFTLTICI